MQQWNCLFSCCCLDQHLTFVTFDFWTLFVVFAFAILIVTCGVFLTLEPHCHRESTAAPPPEVTDSQIVTNRDVEISKNSLEIDSWTGQEHDWPESQVCYKARPHRATDRPWIRAWMSRTGHFKAWRASHRLLGYQALGGAATALLQQPHNI